MFYVLEDSRRAFFAARFIYLILATFGVSEQEHTHTHTQTHTTQDWNLELNIIEDLLLTIYFLQSFPSHMSFSLLVPSLFPL